MRWMEAEQRCLTPDKLVEGLDCIEKSICLLKYHELQAWICSRSTSVEHVLTLFFPLTMPIRHPRIDVQSYKKQSEDVVSFIAATLASNASDLDPDDLHCKCNEAAEGVLRLILVRV